MELRYYVSVLWKWGWLIILATGLSAGFSYRANSKTPTFYQASTTLLVGRSLQAENPNPNDFATAQSLAKDYVVLARSQAILQATVDALGLHESWESLSQQVNTSVLQGADTFTIDVVDRDPRQAKVIADEIARQVILASPTPKDGDPQRQFTNQQMTQLQSQIQGAQAQIADLQKRADSETSAVTLNDLNNQIYVLQQKVSGWQNTYGQLSNFYQGSRTNFLSVALPATVPTSPIGTKLIYNVGLAGGIGLILALGGIIIAEFLDDTVRSKTDANRSFDLQILGGIGPVRGIKQPSDSLFAVKAPQSTSAEACRFLSTNVYQGGRREGAAVLLVTSPGPHEGKSTMAANLAATIARTRKSVVLVDANLHCPSLHRFFDLTNREGLSSLLLDDSLSVGSVLRTTMIPSLRVLTSGALVPNPGGLLASRVMADRMAQIRKLAEVVVLDSASALGAADTVVLGTLSDDVVLVVRVEKTRRAAVREAIATLARVGLKLHGIVLNGEYIGRAAYQRYYAVSARDTIPFTQKQCSHLGLRGDPSSVVRGASAEHRCYVAKRVTTVTTEHQASFCLCSSYATCPRLIQARQPTQIDRVGSRRSTPPAALTIRDTRDTG